MHRILLAGVFVLLTSAASAGPTAAGSHSISAARHFGESVVAAARFDVLKATRPLSNLPQPTTLALVALALLGVLRVRP